VAPRAVLTFVALKQKAGLIFSPNKLPTDAIPHKLMPSTMVRAVESG